MTGKTGNFASTLARALGAVIALLAGVAILLGVLDVLFVLA